MPVYLRQRNLAKGRKRYYLDIWHNGKRSYEFLFVVEPEDSKKEKKELAKTIQRQREEELQAKGTSYIPKHKKNTTLFDFIDNYHSNYDKKDVRMIESVNRKLKQFISDKNFLIKDLTENHFIKFIDFLNSDEKLKGETPHSYYKRFKKMMLQANRDGYINDEVYKNVRFKKRGDYSDTKLTKQVLTEEEIKTLFNTECGNEELKRAFLFSCYSGLGYAEIKILNWSHIVNDRLIINREKTSTEINLSLSPKALELLGERKAKNEAIFNLKKNGKFISETSNNKTLNNWLNRAEIDKHITFYCARHTFATRLLIKGANLKTVSEALAHKTTTNTIKYLNYVNTLKDEATRNL